MTTEGDSGGAIRRVIVLVDAPAASVAALREAATLASRRDAELLGLFVEEEDLLRSAGLPFAREIGPTSTALRRVDAARMERRLRARARDIRRTLEGLARSHAIAGTLQVARGRVMPQVLAAAAAGDLIVVGKSGWSPLRRGRLGSTARQLIDEASLTVMVLEQAAGAAVRPTLALFDHPEAGRRALAVAAQIAQRDGHALTVLVPGGDPAAAAELHRRAEGWLAEHGLEAAVQTTDGGPEALARAMGASGGHILVVSRAGPVMAGGAGDRVLERLATPVVVVP